ncbi:ankyrin [Xylona heveae TC161]|uniref:Ankyrin n=1 Tax=Xylona heveae (strain CBS 132557 / TC161) TaxID=1328760 RepID=A0A165GKL4_XYLHT|nr:ankyrin [Xylona heveae TC161]KZF22306.1 ankyrin [Xylona heveae TC161]
MTLINQSTGQLLRRSCSTPFIHAARWCLTDYRRSFDDEKLCRWLLERGADPNAPCVLDLTPLSVAVQIASFGIIALLFEHGGSIDHGQLLHYAVRRDLKDCIDVLAFVLDRGAPINQIMYENSPASYELQKPFGIGTPLHEAARLGKLDVVDLLLARGADPTRRDVRRQLPVDIAECYNNNEVAERLRGVSR